MTCCPILYGACGETSWALSADCENRSSLSWMTWDADSGADDGLSSGRRGSIVGVLAKSLSNGEIPSSLGEVLSPH